MPTFLFRWRVVPYRPSNQTKEESRPRKITTPTVPSFRPPSRKIKKRGSCKAEGTPYRSLQINQQKKADADGTIDRRLGRAEP